MLKKGRRFDALVTDIDMPDMDGFALAEAVRGEQRVRRNPDHRAVVVTARRNRSSAAARSASTTTSPSSIARASSRRSRSRPPTSSRRHETHHGHRKRQRRRPHHRIRHGDDRRSYVRPADLPRAGRVRAGPPDAGAAGAAGGRRHPQSARPRRDRDRHALAARSRRARAGHAGDGDRHRAQGRVLRAPGRCGRRGDGSFATAPARRSRPISIRGCRGSPPASIGSKASSWSCSTSIACWTSGTVPLPHEATVGASKSSKE